TPQVKAPYAPPPCSAKFTGLPRPRPARLGRHNRPRRWPGGRTCDSKFASRMGIILALIAIGELFGSHLMWGRYAAAQYENCGSAKRVKCSQNGYGPVMPKAKSAQGTARKPRIVFPAPDHDHERCSADAMAVAEALCQERGQRLTAIRRKVLAA